MYADGMKEISADLGMFCNGMLLSYLGMIGPSGIIGHSGPGCGVHKPLPGVLHMRISSGH
jgi:hypothetical protein